MHLIQAAFRPLIAGLHAHLALVHTNDIGRGIRALLVDDVARIAFWISAKIVCEDNEDDERLVFL